MIQANVTRETMQTSTAARETLQTSTALVIEDDLATANAIARVVTSLGHGVEIALTLSEAREKTESFTPALVLVDLGMPDGDGVDIVHELRAKGAQDFIVISGAQSQERVLESLRAGVADFLVKPVKLSEIHRVVTRVVQSREDRSIGVATPATSPIIEPARLVGQSEATRHLRHAVQRVARMSPVRAIITGAPGVGKRNIAVSIHHEGRATGRVIYVNCSQEVDESAAARFFGRVGEDGDRSGSVEGYLAAARDGTLVLDDLSRLPLPLQSSLMTFLDTGKVKPVNSFEAAREVNCAVVGILREPVSDAFDQKRLRENLYYALAESVITVPPLSEREEDTLEIAERAIAELNAITGTDKALSEELRERLRNYAWPGNVVELKSTLRAAYAGTEPDEEIAVSKVFAPALSGGASDPAAHLVGNSFWEVEKKLLLATLEHTGGNKRQAAKILGISLKTLYNRLHAYG